MSSCVIIPPKPRGGTESVAHSHGTACFGGLRPELPNGSEIRYHSRHFRSRLEKSWFHRERSSVDVRLQSAPCGVPTRKGRRQTRNDAVHQLDHARFCRCGRTKRSGVPAPRHGGCVREGGRVRAWVWPFLKLDMSKENWRQGSPLPAAERGQAEHASRCTRIS